MSQHQRPTSLPDQISQHFDLEELRTLCYDLTIDYENVRGETKEAKALALVAYCARQGKLEQLLATCKEKRPFLTTIFEAPQHEPK